MKKNRKSFRLTDLAIKGLEFIVNENGNLNDTLNTLLESLPENIIYISREDIKTLTDGVSPDFNPITYYANQILRDIEATERAK